MDWDIPQTSGHQLPITLRAGDRLFLVGANGSGKSALIQHLYSLRPSDDIKRIAAHRPTALQSESIYFPHPDRVRFDLQIRERESHPNARWKEDPGFAQQKQLAVLFDLVAAENSDARSVRQLLRDRDFQGATKAASEQESPLGKINELFQSANLGITLKLSDTGDILAQHRDGGIDFSIAQMSDGERNAALIAAEVITAKKESVLLIDEPERHLHRSIIEPFLSALFKQRRDCAFVISTHEIALPAADPDARVLMVRSCQWRLGQVRAWDIDLLDPSVDLPEELKVAILGARRRSVFVEGVSSSSLDHPLYDALFPSLSVIPYEGCGRVQEAVRSLRSSQDLHHVEAFGLIDRDDHTENEIKQLSDNHVFALEVYEVEALYYCSEAIAAVACRQAESLNKDPAAMIKEAKQKALECLRRIDLAERMAARRCERRVRNKIQRCLPTWKEIKAGTNISICFDSPYRDELEHFWQLVADQNLDELIARYPLRDSPVFGAIARALRCQTKGDYEQIVLSRVRADEDLALKIKQRIGLTDDILRA
jgi:ABC-type cobalamin/Fe3+-siderophores transport system ATPase subunit